MDCTSGVSADYGLCRCAMHIVVFPYPFSKVSGSLPQNDSFILTFDKGLFGSPRGSQVLYF